MSNKLAKSIDRAIKALNELTINAKASKKATEKCPAKGKCPPLPAKKSKKIELCRKKSQLKDFTIAELKDWLKSNNVSIKNISKKHKDDLVKIVWDTLNAEDEDSSDDDESSDDDDESSDESDSD